MLAIGLLLIGLGLGTFTMAVLPWRSLEDMLLHPPRHPDLSADAKGRGRRRTVSAPARRWAALLGLAPNAEDALLRARVLSVLLALGGFTFMLAATASPVMGGVGAIGMWILPEIIAGRAVAVQRSMLDRQIRGFLRRYKAARASRDSAVHTFRYVLEHSRDPLRGFMERALSNYEHGAGSLWQEVADIARDTGNRDLRSFARILRMDMETGGKVLDAVDTVLDTMRMRDFARRQKRIATAASKGGFMFLLPFPLVVILLERIFVPSFFTVLRDTVGGQVVLAINGGLIIIVVFVLRGYILKGT
jgi:Flp pilus assembly protein TadB